MTDLRPFRAVVTVGEPDGRRSEMFHDYTLTKLAKAHVHELHTAKQAYEVTKSRQPRDSQDRATTMVRKAASAADCPDTAGAGR